MPAPDSAQASFVVAAVVAGVPILVIAIRLGRFAGSIERAVASLETSATSFSDKVDVILEKLCEDIGDHETRIRLLEERRRESRSVQ